MRCTDPRTVGFKTDGKTLAWSQKDSSKEYAPFQLPCGKCLECRLEYARTWAIRCVHEAQMHPHNSFITLTYSDKNLKNPKLEYRDFQLFLKKLRKTQNAPIGVFVTGEYGEKTKRPHWHAILFGYWPKDAIHSRSNERGDKIYTSKTLDKLWGKNDPTDRPNEIGTVTFESAGYVARYAAKKLAHGHDSEEYKPISKKSSKHAIGKKWLEKFWPDIFNYGQLIVNGQPVGGIPRYYEKWLQKHRPTEWSHYVTSIKVEKAQAAMKQNFDDMKTRSHSNDRNEARQKITLSKFNKLLQKHLKF
jgi:hypothetical protein